MENLYDIIYIYIILNYINILYYIYIIINLYLLIKTEKKDIQLKKYIYKIETQSKFIIKSLIFNIFSFLN